MNFGFTKTKSLVTLFIAGIFGIYKFINEPGQILDAITPMIDILLNKFIVGFGWFVVLFAPLFLIWSLFEKKDKNSWNAIGITLSIIGLIVLILVLMAIMLPKMGF